MTTVYRLARQMHALNNLRATKPPKVSPRQRINETTEAFAVRKADEQAHVDTIARRLDYEKRVLQDRIGRADGHKIALAGTRFALRHPIGVRHVA